jgi:hypothetical protein
MRKFLSDIFKDNNDVNEKNFVGFAAFFIMVVFAASDILTGVFGIELVVKDYIYNSFVVIVLGSFGISGVEKIFGNKNASNNSDSETE